MDIATLDVRALRLGQSLSLDGLVHTGRDRLHKHLHEGGALPPGVDLRTSALYHCGPVMVADAGGPTTSSREEPYEADVIAKFGLRVIIGKGGMGPKTIAACREYGCVYLQAVGGAGALIAAAVERVEGVDFLQDFGPAEAMWHLRVRGLPVTVAIDAHGNSLYDQVAATSATRLHELLA